MNQNKLLMEAIAFAARAHAGQTRRDGKTPYVSHVFRAAMTLVLVFGVRDPQMLAVAVLHDTLEDTTTDFDDLEERYGRKIARWTALLSKDKRLPESAREAAYMRQLASAPAEVKLIKLADMHDNLLDTKNARPKQAKKTRQRMRAYLSVLAQDKHSLLRTPLRIVQTLAS